MNTFWLKIASGAIGILIIIVLVSMFMPGGNNEPAPSQSTDVPTNFYDQANKDKRDLLPSPGAEETISNQPPVNTVEQPNNVSSPAPAITQSVPAQQPQSNEITIYAKPLSENETIEAEREINYEVPMFSIGRLPGPSFKNAIDSARRILNRWPDSVYAYKAKEMLAKVPEGYRDQYHITAEEMDTSMFLKPRAGTQPYPVPSLIK